MMKNGRPQMLQAHRTAAAKELDRLQLNFGLTGEIPIRPVRRIADDRRLSGKTRAGARVLLGYRSEFEEKYEQALKHYDAAIRLHPRLRREVLIHKANCLFMSGFDEVSKLYSSVETSSRDPMWHQIAYWGMRLEFEKVTYDPQRLANTLSRIPSRVRRDPAIAHDLAVCRRILKFWKELRSPKGGSRSSRT